MSETPAWDGKPPPGTANEKAKAHVLRSGGHEYVGVFDGDSWRLTGPYGWSRGYVTDDWTGWSYVGPLRLPTPAQPDADARERVARAICTAMGGNPDDMVDTLPGPKIEHWRRFGFVADAALAALAAGDGT